MSRSMAAGCVECPALSADGLNRHPAMHGNGVADHHVVALAERKTLLADWPARPWRTRPNICSIQLGEGASEWGWAGLIRA